MGPRGHFCPYLYHCDYIGRLGTGFMQVIYLGRAPRTKETLPDFLKWRRVTRHPLVFRGLTGSQQTLRIGASQAPFLSQIYFLNFDFCVILFFFLFIKLHILENIKNQKLKSSQCPKKGENGNFILF